MDTFAGSEVGVDAPSVVDRYFATVMRSPAWRFVGPIAVVLGVLLANVWFLVGWTAYNPIASDSGLQNVTQWSLLQGNSNIDRNVGYTTQSLGHYAASLLFHGHLPYWNSFEALGTPLLGEMQSAALFPLTLLQIFSNGALYEHLAMELCTALATYALLRYLGLAKSASVVAGLAFGLNGTFAWLTNAAANPICLLPLTLLAAEMAVRATREHRRGGWVLLAAVLALSVAAGFPEVVLFNCLLVAVWIGVRLWATAPTRRGALLTKLGGASITALLLAAPVLVAFVDFLRVSNNGPNNTSSQGHVALLSGMHTIFLDPYAFGLYWQHPKLFGVPIYTHSLALSGYVTIGVILLAAVGLWGRRDRVLRAALGAWIFVSICAMWGLLWAHQLFNLIPGVSDMELNRYLVPSVEFALIVLAAFGLDDLLRGDMPRRVVQYSTVAVLALVVWTVSAALPLHQSLLHGFVSDRTLAVAFWIPVVVAALTSLALLQLRGRVRVLALCVVMTLEVVGNYMVPTMTGPRTYHVDTPALNYLHTHLGYGRVYAIGGPLQANFGTYFKVPQINLDDLPVSDLFTTYVSTALDTNTLAHRFTGVWRINPRGAGARTEFLGHLQNFENADVKYLISSNLTPAARRQDQVVGVRVVYHDALLTISKLPTFGPLFSAHGCHVTITSVNRVVARCTAPSTLLRREQFMPGWSVTRNGQPVSIHQAQQVFESVRLPAGRSVVTFSFTPPYENMSWEAALVGLLVCVGGVVLTDDRRTRLRRRYELLAK